MAPRLLPAHPPLFVQCITCACTCGARLAAEREPIDASLLAGMRAEVAALGPAAGDDPLHLYYTSGTSGTPKAVLLSHSIVIRHALGCADGALRGRQLKPIFWARLVLGWWPTPQPPSGPALNARRMSVCKRYDSVRTAQRMPGPCDLPHCPAVMWAEDRAPVLSEMALHGGDVWGHIAPMFHLVDAFAIYAVTHVGGRHVTMPAFDAQATLALIGVLHIMPQQHIARAAEQYHAAHAIVTDLADAVLLRSCTECRKQLHPKLFRPHAERERVSVTNLASTMVTLLLSNPALGRADLSSLRLLSCGGSPLPPAAVAAALAAFGCRFFMSYGMTECCGKIAVSLPRAEEAALPPAEQLALIRTSGRCCQNNRVASISGRLLPALAAVEQASSMPWLASLIWSAWSRAFNHCHACRPFKGMEVRVAGDDGLDVKAGSDAIGEVWCRRAAQTSSDPARALC